MSPYWNTARLSSISGTCEQNPVEVDGTRVLAERRVFVSTSVPPPFPPLPTSRETSGGNNNTGKEKGHKKK